MLAESRSTTYFNGKEQPVASGKREFYTLPGGKPKRKFNFQVKVVLAVIAIFAVALLYTATEAKITSYGYEINQLKQSIEEVENTNAQYRLEIEQLSSPERLSEYAAQNLSMVQPDGSNIKYVAMNTKTMASQPAMTASVPSGQHVEIEVLEEESHPVLAALAKIFDDYIVLWNKEQTELTASVD